MNYSHNHVASNRSNTHRYPAASLRTYQPIASRSGQIGKLYKRLKSESTGARTWTNLVGLYDAYRKVLTVLIDLARVPIDVVIIFSQSLTMHDKVVNC